jgi:hypothetical protein
LERRVPLKSFVRKVMTGELVELSFVATYWKITPIHSDKGVDPKRKE